MKNALLYLVCCSYCLILSSNMSAVESPKLSASDHSLQTQIIHSFRKSLGLTCLLKEDDTSVYNDSLLSALEESAHYDLYFELERIMIKSYLLRGEKRLAIAYSDLMYSKAKVLEQRFGLAMSLNAIAEVYGSIGKSKEAGVAYEEALELLEEIGGDDALIKILFMELMEYYISINDIETGSKYLERMNQYPDGTLNAVELTMRHIFNVYYKLQAGKIKEAYHHLTAAEKLQNGLIPVAKQYFLVAEALYWTKIENYTEALSAYDDFFKAEHPESNNSLYIGAMKDKANLLVKMGRKEEAFDQYYAVYSYIHSIFQDTYPKEIDQLAVRFQADHLAYQNERDRNLSILYYMLGIGGCVVLLFVFLFLSWKKIFRLRQSKIKQEEMKRKAEDAIRKKNLFLSNMSHEVRTPLNGIVGFSTLLASDDMEVDDEARKEFCEIIRVNSYQLLKLINDIIDYSDIEGDTINFSIQKYNAVKICNEVINTIAASYKLPVELRFDTDLSELVLETDDARLRQVLINLVVNATKFTKEGSIVLKLELSRENNQIALFSVTDTGCGVPPEKQKQIFERFEKLNDFVQGTGLGLSICQLIVKRINGDLWIDGSYTQGARFCFTHPLHYVSTLENRPHEK